MLLRVLLHILCGRGCGCPRGWQLLHGLLCGDVVPSPGALHLGRHPVCHPHEVGVPPLFQSCFLSTQIPHPTFTLRSAGAVAALLVVLVVLVVNAMCWLEPPPHTHVQFARGCAGSTWLVPATVSCPTALHSAAAPRA